MCINLNWTEEKTNSNYGLFLCNIYCTLFKKKCCKHIWTLDIHISSLVFYPMSYKVRQIICPLDNLTIHWNLHFVLKKIYVGLCGGSFKVAFCFNRKIFILCVHATLWVISFEEFCFIKEKRSVSMIFFLCLQALDFYTSKFHKLPVA